MNNFPQLRVRSGYSFKSAFGKLSDLIERLKDVGANFAGLVDSGTWGAARWEQDIVDSGIVPGYGVEVPIAVLDDEGEPTDFHPLAWMLAIDTKQFFHNSTYAAQHGPISREEFCWFAGVIKFSGGALDVLKDGDFDYIDVNPSSGLLVRKAVERHRATGKPMVITSYNNQPTERDKGLAEGAGVRTALANRNIAEREELRDYMLQFMTDDEFYEAEKNTRHVAQYLSDAQIKLAKAPIINVPGDMVAMAREGQEFRLGRGHIPEWTQEYEDRFNEEIKQIQLKGFDSYFIVVADLVQYAKRHMLVGPARGSSAGSLVCYLLGITEVDPIPHKLLFQRFIDVSRADFPDIDIDFPDTKRHMVLEYLTTKYGAEYVSKLGNVNLMKSLSVIGLIGKKFALDFRDTEAIRGAIVEYWEGDERYGHELEDTFENTDQGRHFRSREPDAAEVMSGIELNPSHSGVHAAGILVCNEPVGHFCTVDAQGIAQIDKQDAEYLNLLKIDVLGLRTLGVIEDAGVMSPQEMYDIPLTDPEVIALVNEDKLSGVFQFEGGAVRRTTNEVNVTRFEHLEQLTALARPGPLSSGMAAKYIERVAGREEIEYPFPEMEEHLSNSYGVLIYQEQIMSIAREIGRLDWAQASGLRRGMAKSKGEEYLKQWFDPFMQGATSQGIPEDKALTLWREMVAFGAYGFNKSHAVAYGVITYWTLYLKRYFRLEFAAASLRAAKDDEQTIGILRELAKEGVQYSAMDPELSGSNWQVAGGKLVGGIMNAKGFGESTAQRYFDLRRDAAIAEGKLLEIAHDESLTDKEKKKASSPYLKTIKSFQTTANRLANAEVKFASIAEAHEYFGEFYKNPELAGVTDGKPISQIKDIAGKDTFLFIGKLTEKRLEDENDPKRQQKRIERGKKGVWRGESAFADLFVVDDSVDQPHRVRVQPETFPKYKELIEGSKKGQWFLFKGWKMAPHIDIFIARAIKPLETPRQKAARLAASEHTETDEGGTV